jgi:hypothetical protein
VAKLQINPPVYPLCREAFRRALITGHGRALIHAENFDVAEYHGEIFTAATTCLVYDTQVEGYREWWLARLCQAAGLIDELINRLPEIPGEGRQRCRLLKEFYLQGHPEALPRLYAMCRFSAEFNDVDACDELIEIDGEKGLIFVARRLGETLLADPDFWVSDWELDHFDDLYGEGSAKRILARAAAENPAIKVYFENVLNFKERHEQPAKPDDAETVEQVINLINNSTKRESRLRRWGSRAALEDREEIAKLLKTELSPIALTNAVICLNAKGLPTFDETLLGLVFHADEEVSFYATWMFANHDEPQVRAAGLALLVNGDLRAGTKMLQLSARSEDAESILSALAKHPPDDDDHGTMSNLIQLIEQNDAIQEPLIPLYIYEFSPCMHCRQRAVEILIQWAACPQWLLHEAAKDGSEEIRQLVEPLDPPTVFLNPQTV